MRITTRHWTLALLAALLLHAGLLAVVALRPPDEGALAAGRGGYEIGLGPAGGAPGDEASSGSRSGSRSVKVNTMLRLGS